MNANSNAATELKEHAYWLCADADALVREKRFSEAIVLLEGAVSLLKLVDQAGEPTLVRVKADLARAYLRAGDYARAELTAGNLVLMVSRERGHEDEAVIPALDLLVAAYMKQGKHKLAIEPAKRALTVKQLHHGAVSRQAADSYYTLAVIYGHTGGSEAAFKHLTSAHHIYAGALGPDRPETARAAARVALLRWAYGLSPDAEREFDEKIKLLDTMLPADDAHLLELLDAQAAVLRSFKRTGEAMIVEENLEQRTRS